MKKFTTLIYAKHNITGEMCTFSGPTVEAFTRTMADDYVKEFLGYCHLSDELVGEGDYNEDGTPDWDSVKYFDEEKTQLN